MYGIGSWLSGDHQAGDTWQRLARYFDHSGHAVPRPDGTDVPVTPTIRRAGARFVAVLPRVALVAVAQKGR
jgi:hypothetical protein